jgi:hypothetical protein
LCERGGVDAVLGRFLELLACFLIVTVDLITVDVARLGGVVKSWLS